MLVDILCNSTLVSPLSTSGNKRNWSIGSMNISLTTLNSFIQLNFNQWIVVANSKKGSICIKKLCPLEYQKSPRDYTSLGLFLKPYRFLNRYRIHLLLVVRHRSIYQRQKHFILELENKIPQFPNILSYTRLTKNSGSMSVSTSH